MATLSAVQEWTLTKAIITTSSNIADGGITSTAVSMYTSGQAPLDMLLKIKCWGDTSASANILVYYGWINEDGTASASSTAIVSRNMVLGLSPKMNSANTQVQTVLLPVAGNILNARIENSSAGCVTAILQAVQILVKDSQA